MSRDLLREIILDRGTEEAKAHARESTWIRTRPEAGPPVPLRWSFCRRGEPCWRAAYDLCPVVFR